MCSIPTFLFNQRQLEKVVSCTFGSSECSYNTIIIGNNDVTNQLVQKSSLIITMGQEILSYPGCHQSTTLVVLALMHMVVKCCQCSLKVTLSCNNVSQSVQGLLEAYFKINHQWCTRKRIHYLYEDGTEQSAG